MKASFMLLSVVAVLCAALSGCAHVTEASPEVEAAVRGCFSQYKEAVEGRDGGRAVELVTRSSLAYYGEMLALALHGDRDDLAGRCLADRFLVLSIRHRVKLDKARDLTGESLYVHVVSKGWFGRTSVQAREVGDVRMVDGTARGVQVVQGAPTSEDFTFVNEQGEWKIDVAYQVKIIDSELKKALKKSKLPEEAFLTHIITIATNRRVPPEIWEPMLASSE